MFEKLAGGGIERPRLVNAQQQAACHPGRAQRHAADGQAAPEAPRRHLLKDADAGAGGHESADPLEGPQADADHLIGSLVLTITVTAFAEVMRPLRFLNIFLGLALVITPFVFGAPIAVLLSSLVCGLALMVLSIPRGVVKSRYGEWNKVIV